MLARRPRPLLLLAFVAVSGVLLAISAWFWAAFQWTRQLDAMSADMTRLESTWSDLQVSTQALLLEADPSARFGRWKDALDRFEREFDGLRSRPAAIAMRGSSPAYRDAESQAQALWAANRDGFIRLSDHLSFLLESAPSALRQGGKPLLLWREGDLASERGIYYHRATIELGLATARFNGQFLPALEDAIHRVDDEVERHRWRMPLSVLALVAVSLAVAGVLLWLVLRSYLSHESTFRSLTSNTHDLIIGFDRQGRVAVANPALARLAGRTPEGLTGADCAALRLPPGDAARLATAVAHVLATGQARQELLAWDPAASSGRYDCAIFAEVGDDGAITGAFAVARDISQRMQLEEQLRQSEKMRVLGQLAGGVAHDFNNMLAGILGAAELLASRLAASPEHHRLLDMITSQSVRAADLTRKMLAFSRQQPASMAAIDLNRPLRDAIELQRTTLDRRIAVAIELAPAPLPVTGDQVQLESAFLNLLINAGHAMPAGGRLRIASCVAALTPARCAVLAPGFAIAPGEVAEVTIADSGTGIDPAIIGRIFEPFFTTKPPGQGTGLGLSAVLGTVQQHGGAIEVDSAPGAGACFRILLPLRPGALPATGPAAGRTAGGSARILLVDDEEPVRTTTAAILGEHGYTVLTAADGAQAVDIFRAGHRTIDLVLLDLSMPVMDGRACFAALRAIAPGVRVIIASGHAGDGDLADLRAGGLAGRIDKPCRGADLLHVVEAALGRRTG